MSEVRDTERMYAAAAAKGCIVVPAGPNELLVDIDDERSLELFHAQIDRLKEFCSVESVRISESPSGNPERKHITVTLSEPVASEEQRLLLQAVLGSDLVREILNWKRIKLGIEPVSVFFEKDPTLQELTGQVST